MYKLIILSALVAAASAGFIAAPAPAPHAAVVTRPGTFATSHSSVYQYGVVTPVAVPVAAHAPAPVALLPAVHSAPAPAPVLPAVHAAPALPLPAVHATPLVHAAPAGIRAPLAIALANHGIHP